MAVPPTRPALRERYDQRRQSVIEGAAQLFAADGYDQTSVQQLADDLGIAAGGIYHYFAGKQELLAAICDQLMRPLLARVAELDAAALEPEAHLRALVETWVAHVVEHRDHMLVFQQERHVIESGEQWKHVRADRKRFERILAGAVAAVPGRRLQDDRLAVAALLGMVNHTAQWYRPGGRLKPAAIADGYLTLLLDEAG